MRGAHGETLYPRQPDGLLRTTTFRWKFYTADESPYAKQNAASSGLAPVLCRAKARVGLWQSGAAAAKVAAVEAGLDRVSTRPQVLGQSYSQLMAHDLHRAWDAAGLLSIVGHTLAHAGAPDFSPAPTHLGGGEAGQGELLPPEPNEEAPLRENLLSSEALAGRRVGGAEGTEGSAWQF